jgi:archaellum component FlaC
MGANPVNIDRLDMRLGRVEETLAKLETTNERIADSLERLVVLETRHDETRGTLARIESMIDALDDRITEVELELPVVKHKAMSASNAIRWVAGLVVAAALGLIWKKVTGL